MSYTVVHNCDLVKQYFNFLFRPCEKHKVKTVNALVTTKRYPCILQRNAVKDLCKQCISMKIISIQTTLNTLYIQLNDSLLVLRGK